MIVVMFQPRFAPLVESGVKRHTIRPKRKRRPVTCGDELSLRQWSGAPYRSKQRIIGLEICSSVGEITINYGLYAPFVWINNVMLSLKQVEELAVNDGFTDAKDMQSWFNSTHSLPFHGVIIYW